MSFTGHKDRHINGKNIVQHLKPTLEQECQFYSVPMPTDAQIAIVVKSLRMHHTMVHAAQYDFSELGKPNTPTDFYPIESSIGRFLRDSPDEILDEWRR